MVQKYSIFAAIQANDVMRNAYLINLVRVLCGLPVSGDSTAVGDCWSQLMHITWRSCSAE